MYNYYCANCGVSASATAKFCRRCGAKLAAQSGGLPAIESESVLPEEGAVAVVSKPAVPEDQIRAAQGEMIAPRLPENSIERAGAGKNGSTSLAVRVTRALAEMRARLRKPAITANAKQPAANNQGAARALERASGLTLHHPFNSALRVAGIALAILLAGSAFLAFRDQNRSTSSANRSGLNLTAPDEKSAQLVWLGKQDRDQGHYEAAIDDFKQAIALTRNHIEAHLLLATSYKAIGRVEDALQTYDQLLKIDEKNLEARFQLAEIYRERGDWHAALPQYERIIALNQSSEQALAALSEIESYRAQRAANFAPLRTPNQVNVPPQSALRLLPSSDNSSHLHPLLPDLTLTALSRQPLPGTNSGIDDAGSARAIAQAHKDYATRYFNAHQYTAAIKEAKLALDFTPDDTDLDYILASSYNLSGQPEMALQHARKCLSGTYASNCKQLVEVTEKNMREATKKAEAAKKKESQRGLGKPFKN